MENTTQRKPIEIKNKYEIHYIVYSLIFISMGFLMLFLSKDGFANNKYSIVLLFAMVLGNIAKYFAIKKGYFIQKTFYLVIRLIEFLLISTVINLLNIGQGAYLFLSIPIIITCIDRGRKYGLLLTLYSYCVIIFVSITQSTVNMDFDSVITINSMTNNLKLFFLIYVPLAVICLICGYINKDNIRWETDNSRLLEEIHEKSVLLDESREEIKNQLDKTKEINVKFEDTNTKLSRNSAEFFTLQEVTQAIGSILDVKELLKYVNDIILGVMGVNYSTIILFDEKRRRLKVSTTNIKNKEELIVLTDNVNCKSLMNCLEVGKPITENFVEASDYPFTLGRGINSLIGLPLGTKSKKYGIVLIEQKYYNAFDEGNVRLLDIIGKQVSIAMENAELYEQMQHLATIDGLTGVYNRLYFQDELTKEFKHAKESEIKLSLVIFDIDFFKKVNDSYGHLVGDKVLKHIAELTKNSLRSTDVLARYGGEEFVILFLYTTLNEAYEKVENIRKMIEKSSITEGDLSINVTVSFGISCFPDTSNTEKDLLNDADNALYEAKESGRNCVRTVGHLVLDS